MTLCKLIVAKVCYVVALIAIAFPSAAQTSQSDRGDVAAVAIMEAVRTDLLTTLNNQDREAVQKVVFYSQLSNLGIADVRAYLDPKFGEPRINMNTGAHYAMLQLSQAVMIAKDVLKQDQDAFLLGYIRYLAYWAAFRGRPMSAVKYAEYYGAEDVQTSLDHLDPIKKIQADGVYRVLNTFIVAHELAHHINKHVDTPFVLPDEKRMREYSADKWAAERLQDIGIPPELAVLSMLIFNELENGTLKGELVSYHPAALRRSVEILNSSISRLEERRPQIETALAKSAPTIDFDTYKNGLHRLKALVQGQLDYELRLDNEPDFMLEKAKSGESRAQMRLVEAYLKGNQKGIALDRKKAFFWSKVVATRDLPYHYFDSAFANYIAGTLISSNDQKQGCLFMASAQKMGLIVADLQMRVFQEKQGACIP